MKSPLQIEEDAAGWLARRDSGNWTDADAAELDRWLEATANRVAYLRLAAAWEAARRLQAVGAGLPSGAVPAAGQLQDSPFFGGSKPPAVVPRTPFRQSWRSMSIAASMVLAVAAGAYLAVTSWGERYSTPVGGIASLPLQDGSHVTLNTASRVRIELTPQERRIDLDRGEAFFEVAKDKKRPFVVYVGDKRVIAVGTKFSVLRDGDDVRVVVTEGTIRLESSREPLRIASIPKSEEGGPLAATLHEPANLSAGTIALATGDDVLVQTTSLPQAEATLSWRQGYLTFHDTPLNAAVEEFNRYNAHKLAIKGANAEAIHISGTFRPGNYQAFVRLLESGFSIRASGDDDITTLSKD